MKIKKLKAKALKGFFTWIYKPPTVMTWIKKGDESDTENFHECGRITWNQVDDCRIGREGTYPGSKSLNGSRADIRGGTQFRSNIWELQGSQYCLLWS